MSRQCGSCSPLWSISFDRTSWQHPLFSPITKCQPTLAMHSICLAQGLLSLVNDASVQKNKQSGFAWVITNKNTTIWKGASLAPGHTEDMYSGRAEAFGLLTGLLFIQSYLSYYSQTHNEGARLQCFCDNQGFEHQLYARYNYDPT